MRGSMSVAAMSMVATVVGTDDMVLALLWLIAVAGFPVVAIWCLRRWWRRGWGWLLAMACLAVPAELLRQREKEADVYRECHTELRLISLTSRLKSMRITLREPEAMDGEIWASRLRAVAASEYRSWTNGAGMLVDCWGNPLRIEVGKSPGEISISSAGRDGMFGTEDDLPEGE